HRQDGEEARKERRVPGDDLGHAVVREARELGRLAIAAQEFDRRHRQRQHLLVARPALHHLDSPPEVPQHRDVHPALERRRQALIAFGDFLHPLEVLEREDVRKNVELAFGRFHAFPHTLPATATICASFASCSACPSGLPLTELAKPHCGLSARLSSGANFAASSIRRSSSCAVSTRALLVETRPRTARFPFGNSRSGSKPPARAVSYSRK